MKFKKRKRPQPIILKMDPFSLKVEVGENSSAAVIMVGFSAAKIGPRRAIEISRWLERYAKWSSVQ